MGLFLLFLIAVSGIMYYGWNYAAPIPPAVPSTTRIACIGDSITCGALLKNRKQNCYPAQLEKMLGNQYSVRNFGVNGHALQKKAYASYWHHRYFRASSEFAPHIVLIMLGTNDASEHNWKGIAPYSCDYRAMIEHYMSLSCRPVVFAMTPPTEFSPKMRAMGGGPLGNERISEMAKCIKKLAEEMAIDVIDINAATSDHPECFWFDGIHPDSKGAKIIAETVYAELISSSKRIGVDHLGESNI